MAVFIVFLRAVNVGGTGKLPMSELQELCRDCGFAKVTTYIQSGNVVLSSGLDKSKVRRKLESALQARMGKPGRRFCSHARRARRNHRTQPFQAGCP